MLLTVKAQCITVRCPLMGWLYFIREKFACWLEYLEYSCYSIVNKHGTSLIVWQGEVKEYKF